MTVTYNLPLSMWYVDNEYMNISYWPMDYPPLCAYTHYLMASLTSYSQPQALILGGSLGYSKGQFVVLMRGFVILLEFAVFVPALDRVLRKVKGKEESEDEETDEMYLKRKGAWFMILSLPPLVFIDHGHFQFNQVMHGFVLWGVAFMLEGRIELAVIAMVLAVNFK